MNSTRWATGLMGLMLLTLLGCLADSSYQNPQEDERVVDTSSSALEAAGLPPVPTKINGTKWFTGNTVDLLTADAFAYCAGNADPDGKLAERADGYLNQVWKLMLRDQCDSPSINASLGRLAKWIQARGIKDCNRSTTGSTNVKASVVIEPVTIAQTIPHTQYSPVATIEANWDLQWAPVNFCMAQRLRQVAPGALSGGVLLLTPEEQRLLMEVTRERAQIAVAHYALLGTVFASTVDDPAWIPPQGSSDGRVRALATWARQQTKPTLQTMGTDFLAAVELLTLLDAEAVTYFRRLASAGVPSGAPEAPFYFETWGLDTTPKTADSVWGPRSWLVRTQALLFGGDPLFADATTPWKHFPAPPYSSVPGAGYDELPYARVGTPGPEVQKLSGLVMALSGLQVWTTRRDLGFGPCGVVDVERTAGWLYRSVEAAMRMRDCAELTPGTTQCEVVTPDDLQPQAAIDGIYTGFLLWTRHGITPAHARSYGSQIAEWLNPIAFENTSYCGVVSSGTRLVKGHISASFPDGPQAPLLTVEGLAAGAPATFLYQPLETHALAFHSRFTGATLFVPDATNVSLMASAESQGFGTRWQDGGQDPIYSYGANERKRVLGATSTFALLRNGVTSSLALMRPIGIGPVIQTALRDRIEGYFAHADEILKLSTAAVGDTSIAIRPIPVVVSDPWPRFAPKHSDGAWWLAADVVADGETSWFYPSPTALSSTCYRLGAITAVDMWIEQFMRSPGTTAFGRSLADYVDASGELVDGSSGGVGAWVCTPQRSVGKAWKRWHLELPLPENAHNGALGLSRLHFIERRRTGFEGGTKVEILPLGTLGTWIGTSDAESAEDLGGAYLATGGSLGASASQMLAPLESDPTRPALLEQAQDDAALAAGSAETALVAEVEERGLCGDGNPQCDTSFKWQRLSLTTHSFPSCSNQGAPSSELRCWAQSFSDRAFAAPVPIAGPVAIALATGTGSEGFGPYSGGSLQGAFLEQYWAISDARVAVELLWVAAMAAEAQVVAADEQAKAYGGQVELNCSKEAMDEAKDSGCVSSPGAISAVMSVMTGSESETCVDGPFLQQKRRCEELQLGKPAADAARIAAGWEAAGSVVSQLVAVSQAARRVYTTGTDLLQLVQKAELAKQQAAARSEISATTLKTSFGVYQSYHRYDIWRASALLESARRYGVMARRAIEARYLVDLSAMHATEPFVAPPSTWADDVYGLNLDLPHSVGLTVPGANGSDLGGIYPNALTDYVNNLRYFVDGYPVARPSAVAKNDTEVITLPGFQVVPCESCEGGSAPADSRAFAWEFLCPTNGDWHHLPDNGHPEQACGLCPEGDGDTGECNEYEQPIKARLRFSLDPWGRFQGDAGTPTAYSKRFNARWKQFMVNLVGTGLRECLDAADPPTCYAEPFLRYDMTVTGPPWVRDFDLNWRAQSLPAGKVEGGKALAAEVWIDPVTAGWNKPYVPAVARTEFDERPFNGVYELTIELGADARIERLKRVQLLVDQDYWVRQQ